MRHDPKHPELAPTPDCTTLGPDPEPLSSERFTRLLAIAPAAERREDRARPRAAREDSAALWHIVRTARVDTPEPVG